MIHFNMQLADIFTSLYITNIFEILLNTKEITLFLEYKEVEIEICVFKCIK